MPYLKTPEHVKPFLPFEKKRVNSIQRENRFRNLKAKKERSNEKSMYFIWEAPSVDKVLYTVF